MIDRIRDAIDALPQKLLDLVSVYIDGGKQEVILHELKAALACELNPPEPWVRAWDM